MTISKVIRALYIDDDSDYLELASDYLDAYQDIDLYKEENPVEALERVRNESFDCVVCDYEMPVLNGIEVLEKLREDYPDLPFILFTGMGSEEVASDAISSGVTDYIEKKGGDEQFELLYNSIRNSVSRNRARTNYREVFEKAADGITIHDPETGEILETNQSFCDLLGYTREELIGASPEIFTASDLGYTAKSAERHLKEAYQEEKVFEWIDETKEGNYIPLEVHLQRAVIGGENRILAIVRDISERKERQKRYKTLIENLPGIVFRDKLDPAWESEYIEGDCEEITGYTADELMEIQWGYEVTHPDDKKETYEEIKDTLNKGEIYEVTYRILTKQGETKWVWERGREVEDGIVEGFITDVTEQKEREEDLSQFETLVETMPMGLFVLDEQAYIINDNKISSDLIGYERGEMIGEHFMRLVEEGIVNERVMEEYNAALSDLLSSKTESTKAVIEAEIQPRDGGEKRLIESHLALLPYEESFNGTVNIIVDITEQREREMELKRQNQRLEEFASLVSHDLRNPLTIANGRLEMAMEENNNEHLDKARNALDRMDEIIDDLLELAKHGQSIQDKKPVPLKDVIQEAWNNTDKPPSATLKKDNAEDIVVKTDAALLCNVFENLFRNSIEHGGEDTTIEIGKLNGEHGFYVEDNGPGIPEDTRESIFEYGYSTNDSTGLGLSIVKNIVDSHGWDIQVTEGKDGGVRFEITTS